MSTSTADNSESPHPGLNADERATSPVGRAGFQKLGPSYLVYLICALAFAAIVTLMHFGDIARESIWLWIAVLAAIPVLSLIANHIYAVHPSRLTMHGRIAILVSLVTTANYLTGWGPVLWGSFAFVALETVSMADSSVWPITAVWSLIGIATGQALIAAGWMPSRLTLSEANALALMGALILLFVIWMAGATVHEKEDAELQRNLSEDRFRSLIQDSSDTTFVIDSNAQFVFVSPAVEVLLGFTPSELLGRSAMDLVHPEDWSMVESRLVAQFQPGSTPDSVLVQFRMSKSGNEWRDVEAVVVDQTARPSVAGYVAHVRDITERKEFEALLAYRALHDPLTGLANRQLILDRAEQMIHRARRSFEPIAAFFIDLDNFKEANDSLGHEYGDRLLQGVADRLQSILRPTDTVGRLGGDEFVILAEGGSVESGPAHLADRIREVLHAPFCIEGFETIPVTVNASIGMAVGDRPTASDLLRDADIALYRAKSLGRDQAVLFQPDMQSSVNSQLGLRTDIKAALSNSEFFLLYQPIIGLQHGDIRGVEALLRWQHPSRGVIQPDDFIPLLEDFNMMVHVGRWVIQSACAQASEWQTRGYDLTVSVNVSTRQLESTTLVDDIRNSLETNSLDPSALMIDITEAVFMRDSEVTYSNLQRLRELGVRIAIDDFGTGQFSRAYLRHFPVDVVKIDRSIIANANIDSNATMVIERLMDVGRALGLETLAKGIEDQSQLDGLRRNHCDSGQGFIFSKPVEPAMIEALAAHLERWSSSVPPWSQGQPSPASCAAAPPRLVGFTKVVHQSLE